MFILQVGPSLGVLGNEARENGLRHSLQERLQSVYQKLGGLALEHMVSLNKNYRCHENIMQIPNELFYDSKIKSSPELDAPLHHLTTFPLVFVCSSLVEEVDPHLEAELLLNSMQDYIISNWPKERWGKRDWNKICLTTALQTQVCYIPL